MEHPFKQLAAAPCSLESANCRIAVDCTPRSEPQPGAKSGKIGADFAARLVVRLIVAQTGYCEQQILAAGRGNAGISRSRQIAMYLMHTSLSLPYGQIARVFSRDRTTVSHACRQIEDQRDDLALNAMLCELEGILELIRPLAQSSMRHGA